MVPLLGKAPSSNPLPAWGSFKEHRELLGHCRRAVHVPDRYARDPSGALTFDPLQMSPGAHDEGVRLPKGQIVPVGHDVQTLAPCPAYVPALHVWHTLLEDAPACPEN